MGNGTSWGHQVPPAPTPTAGLGSRAASTANGSSQIENGFGHTFPVGVAPLFPELQTSANGVVVHDRLATLLAEAERAISVARQALEAVTRNAIALGWSPDEIAEAVSVRPETLGVDPWLDDARNAPGMDTARPVVHGSGTSSTRRGIVNLGASIGIRLRDRLPQPIGG